MDHRQWKRENGRFPYTTPEVQGSVSGVGSWWYLVKCRAIWTSEAGLFLYHRISILFLVHSLDLESLSSLLVVELGFCLK